jgi:outer membrane receptor protein involved in Fe transport
MNLLLKRKFVAGFSLIAIAGFFITRTGAQTAAPTSSATEEKVTLEKFEVTGSRISRTDAETPSPVVRFKSEDIQLQGYTSLAEFVQRLPFNSGSQASIIQTASFTRGASTINPRGLGAHRFLVLINGRRGVTYPLNTGPQTLGFNVSIFNFNTIPLGAIDSFEFEKDGASAIYGSDAVTGVLNIKLKKNFEGISTDYLAENSTQGHDMLRQQANVTAGTSTAKTQMLVSMSWETGNSTFIRDYPRSMSTDYSRFGDTNKGANLNSSANYPANLTLSAAQATAAGFTTGSGSYVLVGGQPTANPAKSNFARVASIPNVNRYDFAQTYQLIPDYTYMSTFVNLNHDFNEHVSSFAQLLFSDNSTKYSFTPSVIQSTQNPGTSTSGTLNIPSTNPYNPLGIDINNFLYRTNFGPPRKYDVDESVFDLVFGFKGQINPDWTWEVGSTFVQDKTSTTARNQIRASDLQAALNGTTRATALNPFGPSDNADIVNKLFTVSNSNYKSWGQNYDANLSGSLFALRDGLDKVGLSVGGELRNEYTQADPDTQAYVGSGGGTPFKGSRRLYSAYAEANIPVLKEVVNDWFKPAIELQAATRFEHYSDFGSTTKPKFAAKFHVNDWLVFRASFSKSFKAPDLGTLYTAQTVAFSSTVLTDPKRPSDPATQLRLVSGGNPKLQPENADTTYAGVLIDMPKKVPSWLKGLEISVDYFKFDLKNLINTPSATTVLRLEDQLPGSVVRDNTQGSPGPIQYLLTVPFNVATQVYEGLDFDVHYSFKKTAWGDFNVGTSWTRINHLKIDYGFGAGEFDNVGFYNNPRWQGKGYIEWERDKTGATIAADYLGGYFNDGYTATGWYEKPVTVTNLSVWYEVWKGIRVTVGVKNVFNIQPPFNGRETSGLDQSTYGWMSAGRTAYVQLKKNF